MTIIGDITSVGQLITAVVKISMDVQKEKSKLFNPKIIADAHLYLQRLQKNLRDLVKTIQESEYQKAKEHWKDFCLNLLHYSERLGALNLDVLDIYYPGMGAAIAASYGADSIIFGYFASKGFTSQVPKKQIDAQQAQFLKLNSEFRALDLLMLQNKEDISRLSKKELINALESLEKDLDACATMFAQLLRENWKPSDLS